MTVQWPRGKTESQTLEFKGRDALKQMKAISRSVVAMLNASGGEIWIGVAEEVGMAVRVEPIEDVEERKQALWNHLVDTLDPIPKEEEVSLESVDTSEGSVLRIEVVKTSARKPYAYRDDGPRFVQRIGARVRPMTTQELRELFAPQMATEEAGESLLGPLLRERERLIGEGVPRYWVRLQPSRRLALSYTHGFMRRCLSDASLTGNRESGWTFLNPIDPLEVRQGHLRQGSDTGELIRIHGDGWIDYRTPLDWLRHGPPEDTTPLIYPYALLERTASVFRLAGTLYRSEEAHPAGTLDFKVAADLALIGVRGWKLRPYSPKSYGYQLKHEERTIEDEDLEGDDFMLERPLVFDAKVIIDEPDRCAYRLLIPVYESFGYSEDKVPSEFDRPSGRLVLPS